MTLTTQILCVIIGGGYLLVGNAVYNSTLASMNENKPHRNNESTLLWIILCLFWIVVVPIAMIMQREMEE